MLSFILSSYPLEVLGRMGQWKRSEIEEVWIGKKQGKTKLFLNFLELSSSHGQSMDITPYAPHNTEFFKGGQ